MRYIKNPVVVEATQWFKNGDHPEDGNPDEEGIVVSYFKDDIISSDDNCNWCDKAMREHGWINTIDGGRIVCPGDYIITNSSGDRYPCKPSVFYKTHKKARVINTSDSTDGYR